MIGAVFDSVQFDNVLTTGEYMSFSTFKLTEDQFYSNDSGFLKDFFRRGEAEIHLLTFFALLASSSSNLGSSFVLNVFQPLQNIPFNSATDIPFSTIASQNAFQNTLYMLSFKNGEITLNGTDWITCSDGFFSEFGASGYGVPLRRFDKIRGEGVAVVVHPIYFRGTNTGDPFVLSVTGHFPNMNRKLLLDRPLHLCGLFGVFNEAVLADKLFIHLEFGL
ncbi:MAG: hypothetical protein QW308_03900 [Candidatus Woesearchaeota archaeon]